MGGHQVDKMEPIEVQLDNGEKLEVLARARAWKSDMMERVKPYDVPWDPIVVVASDFYAESYRLTREEEEALPREEG